MGSNSSYPLTALVLTAGLQHLTALETCPFVLPPNYLFSRLRRRLWIGSSWPIVLVLICASACVCWEIMCAGRRAWRRSRRWTLFCRNIRVKDHVQQGVQHVLPLALLVTFAMVPPTATRIFKTFLCESVDFDGNSTRRYLSDDLDLNCDTDEYQATKELAMWALVVWPVGYAPP